jgi:hypothetical protein
MVMCPWAAAGVGPEALNRGRMTRDLLALNMDLASKLQAGSEKCGARPTTYSEHDLATRGYGGGGSGRRIGTQGRPNSISLWEWLVEIN